MHIKYYLSFYLNIIKKHIKYYSASNFCLLTFDLNSMIWIMYEW